MSDHIPDTGKMVPGKIAVLREIAAMLDHPSVYMGGPSQRNMRRAEQIYVAVAPMIAAAERERCAKVAEACQLPPRLVDGGPMAGWQTFPHEWPQTIAAAIRALGDADE